MNWPKVKLATISTLIMGQSPPGSTYNESGNGELYLTAGDFGDLLGPALYGVGGLTDVHGGLGD